LEDLFELEDPEINRLVWRTATQASPEQLVARYRRNASHEEREKPASWIYPLRDTAWLLDTDGNRIFDFVVASASNIGRARWAEQENPAHGHTIVC
jgi:hypothetical protein